jgi:hypothetical protein
MPWVGGEPRARRTEATSQEQKIWIQGLVFFHSRVLAATRLGETTYLFSDRVAVINEADWAKIQ